MHIGWIRVSTDLATHPKSQLLAEATGEPFAWALMVRLWGWMAQYADDGCLSPAHAAIAERASGWTGERGYFLNAAVECGFASWNAENWQAHDWEEFQGSAIREAKHNAERQRRFRNRRRITGESSTEPTCNVTSNVTSRVTSPLRNGGRNVTRRDVTEPKAREALAPAQAVEGVAVFNHFLETFGKAQRTPGEPEKQLITERLLEGRSPDELKRAITGLRNSDWHRKKGFQGLRHALADAETVDRCILWADNPPDTPEKPSPSRAALKSGMGSNAWVSGCEAPGCIGPPWDGGRYCYEHQGMEAQRASQ